MLSHKERKVKKIQPEQGNTDSSYNDSASNIICARWEALLLPDSNSEKIP